MSTPVPTSGADRGAALGPPPVERLRTYRRRPALAALGLVLVALGAIGAYWLVTVLVDTQPYLAVENAVEVGATIGDEDLTTVRIVSSSELAPIPAAERSSVVGRHARVDLVPGTLLTAEQITDEVQPGEGEQLVGIEVTSARLPSRTPRAGDRVLLVVLPDAQSAERENTQAVPVTIEATVVDTSGPQSDGDTVVDVVVSAADGPVVASLAAQGRLAISIQSRS